MTSFRGGRSAVPFCWRRPEIPDPVRIGLLDSGVSGAVSDAADACRAFALDDAGELRSRPGTGDSLGHGTAIARIIHAGAPAARFVVAQIFQTSFATSPAVVAAGLAWLVEQRVSIINMSFGLRADRPVLREACAAAVASGIIVIAAAPARGPAVYPGAYPGVIRVSGDARCRSGELSDLWGGQADFGACPLGPDARTLGDPVGGASFAAAHATAAVADYLFAIPAADPAAVIEHLRQNASYHGPERRTP